MKGRVLQLVFTLLVGLALLSVSILLWADILRKVG